jgi:hypothetical protein
MNAASTDQFGLQQARNHEQGNTEPGHWRPTVGHGIEVNGSEVHPPHIRRYGK